MSIFVNALFINLVNLFHDLQIYELEFLEQFELLSECTLQILIVEIRSICLRWYNAEIDCSQCRDL